MTTFEYEGVKITLQPATGLARMKLSRLQNMYPDYWNLPDDYRSHVFEVLNLLYLVEKVEGKLPFPVPTNGDATPETLKACVDGIFKAHETLYIRWANAVHDTRNIKAGDPDLLPPSELTDEQKKIRSSKPSDNDSKKPPSNG